MSTVKRAAASRKGDSGQSIGSKYLLHEVSRQDRGSLRTQGWKWMSSGVRDTFASNEDRAQSDPGAPIIVVKDLTREHGDRVSIDLPHDLIGKPIMGTSKTGAGHEEDVLTHSLSIGIGRYRKLVNAGDVGDEQMRGYDIRGIARKSLHNYYPRLNSEVMMCHLYGARGKYMERDMILDPVEPNPRGNDAEREQAEYLINELQPPYAGRHFFGGNATSIDAAAGETALTANSTLSVKKVQDIATQLREMAYPPQAVDMSQYRKVSGVDGFYPLFVSPTAFKDLMESDPRFDIYMANAVKAKADFDHPFFRMDAALISNILVVPCFMPVRWYKGDTMKVRTSAGIIRDAQVPGDVEAVDRCVLVGAQSLGHAHAGHGPNNKAFDFVTAPYDNGRKQAMDVVWWGGMEKLIAQDRYGNPYELGTITLDVAVDAKRPVY